MCVQPCRALVIYSHFGPIFAIAHSCLSRHTMAPKPKGKAAAKSTGTKLSKKEREKLMQKARTFANQVLRENSNFKGWSHIQKFGTEVSGKTLFDKIVQDKFRFLAKLPNAPVFGSTYYRQCAGMYGDTDGGSDRLRARDPDEKLSASLVSGIVGWIDTPKQPELIFEWLSQSTEDLCFFNFFCFVFSFVFVLCVCVCFCLCVSVCVRWCSSGGCGGGCSGGVRSRGLVV